MIDFEYDPVNLSNPDDGHGDSPRAGGTKINAAFASLKTLLASIANPGLMLRGAWAPSTAYNVNDLVIYGGQTYIVSTAFTSGPTFSTTNLLLAAAKGTGLNFRGAWAANTAYALQDVTTYGGRAYIATAPFTSGSSFSLTNLALFADKGADGTGNYTVNSITGGATQTLTLPAVGGATYYDIVLTTDCTLTLNGATTGVRQSVICLLHQDSNGGHAVTWPTSVLWANGAAPSMGTTAGNIIRVEFETFDGGTTILGRY